ncbi:MULTISPECIES: hypothetical protein [unclassified Streptomyces]|uniref:hypothetical protein n=1 Tax=unclassified Streptomyces TaxID=2593676 RepID=UPI0022539DF0|nr:MULTISPECIES: hypothetical protein [unclassified Streptomyces]MCX4538186.1 hypothetical protein [Streptomyces sp. NBC_01669]WSA05330.1 hypothetical protein OHA79_48115 [Streptomyces sp. NBC_00841]
MFIALRGAFVDRHHDAMPVKEPTNAQKHQGGRHLVLAEALLRGLSSQLRGAATYVEVGGHVAQVMVAAQGAWMIADIDATTALTCERVILVDVTDGRRDFYVAEGPAFRAGVRARHEAFLQQQGGTRPRNPDSKHTAVRPKDVAEWRDRWDLLQQA